MRLLYHQQAFQLHWTDILHDHGKISSITDYWCWGSFFLLQSMAKETSDTLENARYGSLASTVEQELFSGMCVTVQVSLFWSMWSIMCLWQLCIFWLWCALCWNKLQKTHSSPFIILLTEINGPNNHNFNHLIIIFFLLGWIVVFLTCGGASQWQFW